VSVEQDDAPRATDAEPTTAPTDRTPKLVQISRVDDLQRALRPFLRFEVDGVALFGKQGEVFVCVSDETSPPAGWDVMPAEALASSRGLGGAQFGIGDHVFCTRPAFAGADRVGTLAFSASVDDADRLEDYADAISGVVAALLQAGFATWVTSELHLAASESSYIALENQNAELERAIAHLREVDMLKSNFLATVSHELRTPLTSVIGFADMLLQDIAGKLNEEQREYVSTIHERGEALLRLITQILEMSRMEMGTVHLSVTPTTVLELAERAITTVQPEADARGVVLRHELGVDDPHVAADPDKIERVLTNLIYNAIKFTREGGEVVVTACVAPIRRPFEEEDFFGTEDDDAMAISVRDTGIGIPEEQLRRIFEAFYQVDATSTREHGGAGLGLAIVKKLIDAHGGEVWAESAVGVGTTFTFTLPIVR
jgi:signal transduction histidine kinase